MKESDKKKIGEAYLRLHSCNEEEGMTNKEAISIMNVIIHMIEPQYDTDRVEEAVSMAIKALETQERLTKMLYKQITAYAEMKKSKHFSDLEYGRMTAYAHCLEVLNDDE